MRTSTRGTCAGSVTYRVTCLCLWTADPRCPRAWWRRGSWRCCGRARNRQGGPAGGHRWSGGAVAQGAAGFAVGFSLADGLALVVETAAPGERQLQLGPPIAEVDLQRDQLQPVLLGARPQPAAGFAVVGFAVVGTRPRWIVAWRSLLRSAGEVGEEFGVVAGGDGGAASDGGDGWEVEVGFEESLFGVVDERLGDA